MMFFVENPRTAIFLFLETKIPRYIQVKLFDGVTIYLTQLAERF